MSLPGMSRKERIVLELLVEHQEMFGLELVKANPSELSRGAIYVILSRMADKGFVESRTVPREHGGGRPHRAYRVTGLGMAVLAAAELMHAGTAKGLL